MKKNKLAIILYETFFAVLALVVVSFAWFTYSDEISTTGINLEIKGAINISISSDQTTWDTATNISPSGAMKLTELSGDGINLFSPVVADKKVTGYTNVSGFNQEDLSYLEFKFYINSNGPTQLTYGVGCSVVPVNSSKLQDNIAGAIRVACFDTTGGKTPTSSVVWAPNSTYQYSNGAVNKNGTVESKYTYATNSSTTLKEVVTNGEASGVSNDKDFIWGEINEQMVADMNPFLIINSEYGTNTVSEVTVRIWIEGTDREAVKDLIGGQFKVHLSFKAGDVYED